MIRGMRHALVVAVGAWALAPSAWAATGEAWRWTGTDGTQHYGDQPAADARAPRRLAASAPAPLARLRMERRNDEHLAWVQNPLDGPIEVLLRAEGPPPQAMPALPARATVPARTERLLTRIAAHGARADVALTAIPGHPNARPRDVEYGYPLAGGAPRIGQSWGGGFSHTDAENRYAIDLAAPVGTPVLAARDGVVMQIEDGFEDAGDLDDDAVARANFVRILHDDGSMALYAHLQAEGVEVRPGQRVRRGDRIARSGNSGLSSGPHLHFAVQVNRGLTLASIPFRMFGPGGVLRLALPPDDAQPVPTGAAPAAADPERL